MCIGCWAIGGPFYDRGGWMGYGTIDEAEAIRCLHRALDLGVNFFDTSDVYGCGQSERLLGEAFGNRPDVVISDKFGFVFDEATRTVTGQDATPAAIRRSLEASLKRLQREQIDLYALQLWDYPLPQPNGPTAGTAAEVFDTLDVLVAEGKIRAYCWLTDDLDRVRYATSRRHCGGAPQLLNLLESNPKLIDLCAEKNLPVLCRRPLCMGLLSGKFTPDSQFADNDMRKRFGWNLQSGKQATWLKQLATVREVLTRNGRTVAQGSLAWIWARSPLAIPCPGFKNLAQLEENVRAREFGPLSEGEMREIERLMC